MNRSDVECRRIEVHPLSSSLEIVIKPRRDVPAILFVACWLSEWQQDEVAMVEEIIEQGLDDTLPLCKLCVWTASGLASALVVLWQFAGREIIQLHHDCLVHERVAWPFHLADEYDLDDVRHIRTATDIHPSGLHVWDEEHPGLSAGHGAIAFNYGVDIIHIGRDLDSDEAATVVEALCEESERITGISID